jgi:uncharacterized membrane protein YgcG
MKKFYLILTEILILGFILSGCECGPGSGTPIETIEPPEPPSTPPPPPPPTTQNEYFQREGNDLVYFDGTRKYYLIKGKVEDVKFNKVAGDGGAYYVNVVLKLKDGEIRTSLDSLIALRNINRTITSQSTQQTGSGDSSGSNSGGGSGGSSGGGEFQPVEPPSIPVIRPGERPTD